MTLRVRSVDFRTTSVQTEDGSYEEISDGVVLRYDIKDETSLFSLSGTIDLTDDEYLPIAGDKTALATKIREKICTRLA